MLGSLGLTCSDLKGELCLCLGCSLCLYSRIGLGWFSAGKCLGALTGRSGGAAGRAVEGLREGFGSKKG